jgi:hypothetical protein
MLQPRTESFGSTPSESLISLLSESNESEYILSTNGSGELVSEVEPSGNNGAVISDSDSVITIISISDDPVTSIAPSTSISDNPDDVVVTLLESTDADDTITNTLFSDIHHDNHDEGADEIKSTSNGGSSKQVLVKVSDLRSKGTLVLRKRANQIVSEGKQEEAVRSMEGF